MKGYEKYKKVDLPWIDEIPEHWEVKANKTVLKLHKEIVGKYADKYELLSLTKTGIKIKGNDNFSGKMPEHFENYQIVKNEHLVMCLFDLDQSAVFSGVSCYEGKITSAYDVFDVYKENTKFVDYYFRYIFQERKYKVYSKSVRYTITMDDFGRLKSVLPPLEEQEQIAKFLDWKISEIDRLIDLQNRKNLQLNEYKKSFLIHLLRNEKDCKVVSLKSMLKPKSIRKYQTSEELELLSVVREQGIILRDINDQTENHNIIPEDLSNYKVVIKNDFVMNKMKAWQGSYGISELSGIVSPAYFVFDVRNKDVDLEFFHMTIRCSLYISQFAKYSKGIRVGQWDFDLRELRNIQFKYPPKERQMEIVKKVKGINFKIDEIAFQNIREIIYLQELKQRLISDAVTGKIDVRQIKIPDTK